MPFVFFYLVFTLYFSIEIVGLKCSIEEKKLKIITCFTRIKKNQKIALSIFLTNRLTSCVIEGIGFQRRAKEKPFIPWQGQLGEKEGNFPFMPVKGPSSEQAQFSEVFEVCGNAMAGVQSPQVFYKAP